VAILGRNAWVWDNSRDVVVARMVEAGDGFIDAATLADWRACATVGDLALDITAASDVHVAAMLDVLSRARTAIERHGDVVTAALEGWSVLDGEPVSGGYLRVEPLPVGALLDVASGFEAMLSGTFEPDPPGGWWLLGAPDGRSTAPMRLA
jgi:hypothetical protein